MRWWLRHIIVLNVISIMSTTIIVNQNVVFEKIETIATTRSKWIVATVFTLDPYDKLLNQLNQGLNVIGKSLTNIMSQEANHAIRNGSLLVQFGRMLTMHDTISRDVKQLFDKSFKNFALYPIMKVW